MDVLYNSENEPVGLGIRRIASDKENADILLALRKVDTEVISKASSIQTHHLNWVGSDIFSESALGLRNYQCIIIKRV